MANITQENILQQVQTYNESGLGLLYNEYCAFDPSIVNFKFKNFQDIQGQLGTNVTFDLRVRFNSVNNLVINPQAVQQRVYNLTVDQQISISYPFTAQQFLYNVEDYMDKFGISAVAQIGTTMESNVLGTIEESPFRFFGDGISPISTFLQLDQAITQFKNFGSANTDLVCILPDTAYPRIVNSGLNQFAPLRNNEMAATWKVGEFQNCRFYRSNLLPVHVAGTEGQAGSVLTVVSTTRDASNAIIAITVSGTDAANDPNSIKKYDRFVVNDNVPGFRNIRFSQFIGYKPSINPVQFKAAADAQSTGTNQVTITLDVPLQPNTGIPNQSSQTMFISGDILPGMTLSVMPTTRQGVIMAGKPLFVAMPEMPDQTPYPYHSLRDEETGVSMQMYYGVDFGNNTRIIAYNQIWGRAMVPEYTMAMLFPEY